MELHLFRVLKIRCVVVVRLRSMYVLQEHRQKSRGWVSGNNRRLACGASVPSSLISAGGTAQAPCETLILDLAQTSR